MHFAILAAGEGSRLRNEGIDVPKPLVWLNGETLLGRLINLFRSRRDCEGFSVIVNPDVAEWAAANGSETPWEQADNVIIASTPGSMSSLALLAPHLATHEQFCLTTVDTVFHPEEFHAYLDSFAADRAARGSMAVTTFIDDERPLYISVDPDSMITGYFDSPLPSTPYVSGGIYALPASALDILDECARAGMTRLRDFQRALVASGMKLRAYPFSAIIDVDHAADIPKAEALLSSALPSPPPSHR